MKNYYHILQVHEFASTEMIKMAYKMLSKRYHPDVNASDSVMYLINEAYEILSDPIKRKSYDERCFKHYIGGFENRRDRFTDSVNSITYLMIKSVLEKYMKAIKNKDYHSAYQLLSEQTKAMMFKKDFIKWQTLVSEVHIIEEFQCAFERIGLEDSSDNDLLVFKVRVIEFNVLLNQYEEDYFDRRLIFENGKWRILLNQVNINKVINKYKRIVAVNKRSERSIKRYFDSRDKAFHSGYVTKENFLNSCDYEFKRFKRYKRSFSLIAIPLKSQSKLRTKTQVITYMERYLRTFDVFCLISDSLLFILLPETNQEGVKKVQNKLQYNLEGTFGDIIGKMRVATVSEEIRSVKDVINRMIKGCKTDGL